MAEDDRGIDVNTIFSQGGVWPITCEVDQTLMTGYERLELMLGQLFTYGYARLA